MRQGTGLAAGAGFENRAVWTRSGSAARANRGARAEKTGNAFLKESVYRASNSLVLAVLNTGRGAHYYFQSASG
jgi:hypothetical protein